MEGGPCGPSGSADASVTEALSPKFRQKTTSGIPDARNAYALGRSGDFALQPTPDGYVWEIPQGPDALIRYTATIRDNTLREVGDRIAGSRPPVRIFEMTLTRIGDSDWPAANPVPPR